ncbi:MAG: aspartyl protease family protein [Cyanobacteria bacterium P01_G01_bin.39]
MFNYGIIQSPGRPTPQASIKLSNPSNESQWCHVDAIVDTGVTMTCIPESAIKKLGKSLIYSTIKVRDANENIRGRTIY